MTAREVFDSVDDMAKKYGIGLVISAFLGWFAYGLVNDIRAKSNETDKFIRTELKAQSEQLIGVVKENSEVVKDNTATHDKVREILKERFSVDSEIRGRSQGSSAGGN